MKSYKALIVIVIVLILINCVLMTAFWYKQKNLFSQGAPPAAANEYLSKELKLTADQQKAYDDMRKQHFEYTRKLNDESHTLRDSFFENIKTPVLDTAAANNAAKKISDIQLKLDMATLNHFRKLRAILNADQQNKFDHIIKNALHIMGGPHGPGGRPGPPDGMRPPNGMPPPRDGFGPGNGQGPPPDGPPPPNN